MEKQVEKLKLPQVTLIALTSVNVKETIEAMRYSMRGIEFGDAVLVTHRKPFGLPKEIRYSHTSKLKNIDDFNYKAVYELGEHVHTEYALLVHADGFVVHPEMWRDELLEYDYIGAPWPLPAEGDLEQYRDTEGNLCRVGNSMGIRSKRLMDFPKKNNIPWEGTYHKGILSYNEDIFICCKIRKQLEAAGMQIAPLEVAKYFAHEHMLPELEGITPFAFHKWRGTNAEFPKFYYPTLWMRFKKLARKILRRG